jgi:hypothetical protein
MAEPVDKVGEQPAPGATVRTVAMVDPAEAPEAAEMRDR